jgi:hypothetical protein
VKAGEPVRRSFHDHLQDQVVEFLGDQLVVHGQGNRPFLQVLVQQFLQGIGPEWRAAACQFITRNAEAVNIGKGGGRLTADLLGGDVAGGPLARNLATKEFTEAGKRFHGQRIVDHAHLARLVHDDVLWLDVAMDPALVVHVCQGRGRLLQNPVQLGLGHRIDRRAGDRQLKVIGREVIHHEIGLDRILD